MNSVDISNLPPNYNVLIKAPPSGFRISTRILTPCLIISRINDTFSARLGTRRTINGNTKLIQALSNEHTWVLEGETIYPLPHDVAETARNVFKEFNPDRLTYSQILALEKRENIGLSVYREILVPKAANDQAALEPCIKEIPGLTASLYEYQSKGVAWMSKLLPYTGGVILADEMGLGKTMQIISLFLLDPPQLTNPALIVCPTTLIANWVRELTKFAPSLSSMVHRGAARTGLPRGLQTVHVVITTYDTLVNDIVLFSAFEWSFVICDEAQALKNPDSRRRQAASKLIRRQTIPVTGTPVENSLLDLWSLMDFAIPGILGTRQEFEKSYPDSVISAQELSAVTDPYILKRQVADVAKDLPERIDIDLPVELGEELAIQYENVRVSTMEKYPKAGALVATGQLQLFCAHPWLRTDSVSQPEWEDHVSLQQTDAAPLITPKIERTLALLEEAFSRRKKVLIFANFNDCGELLRKAATDLSQCYWHAINGSTPQEQRQAIVDEFSSCNGPAVLILNPRAAGSGLNITAATIVIHFTQVWNPALERQASARAHRRGQTEPVTIYRLFYIGTIEEVMLDRTHWKSELGNEAVPVTMRDGEDLSRALSISPLTNNV